MVGQKVSRSNKSSQKRKMTIVQGLVPPFFVLAFLADGRFTPKVRIVGCNKFVLIGDIVDPGEFEVYG